MAKTHDDPKPHDPAPAAPHPPAGASAPAARVATPAKVPLIEPLKEDGTGTPERPTPTFPIWVQPEYGDTLAPGLAFQPREPLIHIGGVEHRHVADHADGTWIYRSAK